MIAGQKNGPSDNLLAILNKLSPSISKSIAAKITVLGQKFTSCYTAPSDDHPGSHVEFATNRLKAGEKLFYKILEKIILMEQKTQRSLGSVLEHDIFIQVKLLFTI